MANITIYHNPRCSKSRESLALLEQNGVKPAVMLYLNTPPTIHALGSIIQKLGISPRELLRTKEEAYAELGLSNPALSDDDLIATMTEHPKLIERPIVIKGNKAVIGRPANKVLSLI